MFLKHKKSFLIATSLLVVIFSSGFAGQAKAEAEAAKEYLTQQKNEKTALAYCEMQKEEAMMIPCIPLVMTGFDCSKQNAAIAKANAACAKYAAELGATEVANALMAKTAREEWWSVFKDKARESLAIAFKQSLSTFGRKVAHDTAVWIASGGKGQKPLFITEGWGPYLKNAADSALGDFIGQIGKSFGVDLCRPNFKVTLAIQAGLDYKQIRKVDCSFSTMAANWQSAISNPNFSVSYKESLRPGANDISFALIMADQRNSYIAEQVNAKTKQAETDGLWKPITDVAGYILTPGTVIADTFRSSQSKADGEIYVWTDSIADIVQEFLNTLTSELIKNLQSGLFSATPIGKSNSSLSLPNLSSLFNPNASPITSGIKGSETKYASLVTSQVKVGSQFDVLLKLSTCPESAKTNPGPTDCVIDSVFAEAIKNKVFVSNLPADKNILNRPFAPQINSTNNVQTEIPYRSILILRTYRIVPVGWEIAANIIKNPDGSGLSSEDLVAVKKKNWTLADLMNCFDGSCGVSAFTGLIDPYWVLKNYEGFCRRTGYGAQNTAVNDQNSSISRNEYCADQQQCLFDDSKGNCKAYGYCTEERRLWDIGTSCDSKYNTCQSYTSRSGSSNSLLTNTLDFSNCSAQNAGCRSYATIFNAASHDWQGDVILNNTLNQHTLNTDTTENNKNAVGIIVAENHSVNEANTIKLGSSCTQSFCNNLAKSINLANPSACTFANAKCTFTADVKCTIPAGGISCYTANCFETINILSAFNSNFEQFKGANHGDADKWTDELSYLDINNRHYRDERGGKSGAGFKVIASNNSADLITTLPNIPLTLTAEGKGKTYKLKFSVKGFVNQGAVNVGMTAGASPYSQSDTPTPLGSVSFGGEDSKTLNVWKNIEIYIDNSAKFATGTLVISASIGSIANLSFDNFEMYEMKSDCSSVGVQLFTSLASASVPTNKYFDRDVQSCSSAAEGCSQFIRTKADIGNNLIPNGGFEEGLKGWPSWATDVSGTSNLSIDNSGQTIVQYSSDSYSTYKQISIDAGLYYSIGFDAGQLDSVSANLAKLELIFIKTSASTAAGDHLTVLETNCKSGGDNSLTALSEPKGTSMERYTCWFRVPDESRFMAFKLFAGSLPSDLVTDKIIVDNIKLEKVSYQELTKPGFGPSAYSLYNPSLGHSANQIAYLNKAPDYFGCYRTSTSASWPMTKSAVFEVINQQNSECARFAPVCAASEVGCELYKPVNGDPVVPGIVDGLDICPKECVGYQVYKQEKTMFVQEGYKQFIADAKTKYCSASYAGCDEFTNLDELGRGAEKKEYYVRFKSCKRPSTSADNKDATYFTWEGSDTTGFQLKSFKLFKSDVLTDPENTAGGTAPCTNLSYIPDTGAPDLGNPKCEDLSTKTASDPNDSSIGAEARRNAGICKQSDMATNADCREFTATGGTLHYRLLSRTITVSDNCHPYRRTQTQANITIAKTDCENNVSGTAGWWKTATNECIYMAIPNEGLTCPSTASGCRAYTGNRGNNVRVLINSTDFIPGSIFATSTSGTATSTLSSTTVGWMDKDGGKDGLMISYESTYPGGNSLTTQNNNYILRHAVSLLKNHTYTLSFWAKANLVLNSSVVSINGSTVDDLSFKNTSSSNEIMNRSNIIINTDWQRFDLGPLFWTGESTSTAYLTFNFTNTQVYLDNIILKELNNNIFAIENSWWTPVSCDNKLDDANGDKAVAGGSCSAAGDHRCVPGEMLGCSAYTDRLKNPWYLKTFSSLCRKEAVGCESLVDTHNSDSADSQTFNSGDYDKAFVPADNLVYLVNDQKFSCSAAEKGCSAMGLPVVDKWDEIVGYQTLFLKDNPNRYQTDLCKHEELWCEEFATNNSYAYFKSPHGKMCDYSEASSTWFKTGTKEICDATFDQTFGSPWEQPESKRQPIGVVDAVTDVTNSAYNGWAGTCPTAQSGCTEYIDPLTTIYQPEIYVDNGGAAPADYHYTYNKFRANTLYSLWGWDYSARGNMKLSSSNCKVVTSTLNNNPTVGDTYERVNSVYLKNSSGGDCNLSVSSNAGTDSSLSHLETTKAGTYYKIADSIDKTSCNGQVDFSTGCVLFNDRSGLDYSKLATGGTDIVKYLLFDPYASYHKNVDQSGGPITPVQAASGNPLATCGDGTKLHAAGNYCGYSVNTANAIIKVRPDRQCNNWYSCSSYVKGEGNTSNNRYEAGDSCLNIANCDSLSSDFQCDHLASTEATPTPLPFASYAESVNNRNKTGFAVANFYPLDEMPYKGEATQVPNGTFENTLTNGKPIGWSDFYGRPWDSSMFSAVSANDAPEGSFYLKLNFNHRAISDPVEVMPNIDYYLTYWVNTANLKCVNDVLPNTPVPIENCFALIDIYDKTAINVIAVSYITNPIPRAGVNWTKVTVFFNSGANNVIYLIPYNNAELYSGDDAVAAGAINSRNHIGYSFFDNIQLSPVLEVTNKSTDELDATNKKWQQDLAKECRVFPSQNAPSCSYYGSNSEFYYGIYGYCLTKDPAKPNDCLQWWPVDKIKGEEVSDFALGYSGRRPLYYCVESSVHASNTLEFMQSVIPDLPTRNKVLNSIANPGTVMIPVTQFGLIGNVGPISDSDRWRPTKDRVTAAIGDTRDATFEQFSIDPDYAFLLRSPYILQFSFSGMFAGYSTGKSWIGFPITVDMQKCQVCFSLFGLTKGICARMSTSVAGCATGISDTFNANLSNMAQKLYACYVPAMDDYPQICQNVMKFSNDPSLCEQGGRLPYSGPYDAYRTYGSNTYDMNPADWVPNGGKIYGDPTFGIGCASSAEKLNYSDSGSRFTVNSGDGSGCIGDACYSGCNSFSGGAFSEDGIFKTDQWKACAAHCQVKCGGYNSSEDVRECYCGHPKGACLERPIIATDTSCYKTCLTDLENIRECEKEIDVPPAGVNSSCSWKEIFSFRGCLIKRIFGLVSGLLNRLLFNFNEDDVWGGWGIFGFAIGKKHTPIVLPISWHNSLDGGISASFTTIETIIGVVSLLLNVDIMAIIKDIYRGPSTFGMKIVTDEDTKYTGVLKDPEPEIPGNILGFAWHLNTSELYGAGMTGIITGKVVAHYCMNIVQVVTSAGQNKAYFSRTAPGTAYVIQPVGVPNNGPITYTSDYQPFGALVAPGNSDEPMAWDSKTSADSPTKQPLFFETPNLGMSKPYQARAGGLFSLTDGLVKQVNDEQLQKLFARSYKNYQWVWDNPHLNSDKVAEQVYGNYFAFSPQGGGHYQEVPVAGNPYVWDLVSTTHPDDVPVVTIQGSKIVSKNGSNSLVQLSFTVQVNPDQLPIKGYTVYWGDGEVTSVSGIKLNDRINPSYPFTMYHLYSYDMMLKKMVAGTGAVMWNGNPVIVRDSADPNKSTDKSDVNYYSAYKSYVNNPPISGKFEDRITINPSVKVISNWDRPSRTHLFNCPTSCFLYINP